MKIGYARAFTKGSSIDIQIAALQKAGCKKIFQEKVLGTKWERPELQTMLNSLHTSDIVVVSTLDRFARSSKMLLEITNRILASGAKFTSLSEPWADTTGPSGQLIIDMFTGLAAMDRDMVRSVTETGRKAALARGVKFGRPSKVTDAELKAIRRLIKEGQSIRQLADAYDIHFTTLYRLLRS